MSKFSRSLLCGLVVTVSSVTAAPISQLISTGKVVSGSVDQRWRITQNAETPNQTTAYAVTQNLDTLFPFYYDSLMTQPVWAQNDTNSTWLSNKKCAGVAADDTNCSGSLPYGARGSAVGDYTYSIDFDLTNLNPLTAAITGKWMSDGMGKAIYLNGVRVDMPGMLSTTFAGFTDFSINSNFLAGLNTLSFQIGNAGDVSGLRVQLSGTASPTGVPEPASYVLLSAGLAGLAFLRRRRA